MLSWGRPSYETAGKSTSAGSNSNLAEQSWHSLGPVLTRRVRERITDEKTSDDTSINRMPAKKVADPSKSLANKLKEWVSSVLNTKSKEEEKITYLSSSHWWDS